MSITSGYNKYKRYTKLSDGTYKLVSQWTNSNTVEMDNGSTLQATLGNTSISGIGDGTVTGAIDSLNSNTSVKTSSITGQTDSNGLLYSEFKTTDTMMLYAYAPDCVVVPVAVGGAKWAFHFCSLTNNLLTNNNVTCTFYYYRSQNNY